MNISSIEEKINARYYTDENTMFGNYVVCELGILDSTPCYGEV
jgi:hypothetical protein